MFYFGIDCLIYITLLSVCVCVCLTLLVNKIPAERMDAAFAKRLLTALARTLLKLVTLGQRSRSQGLNIHFFLHDSLLISLSYISALLCLIKLKFCMTLRYTLCRFVFEFHKNQMDDDVMVTSFKFSPCKCLYMYSKFY